MTSPHSSQEPNSRTSEHTTRSASEGQMPETSTGLQNELIAGSGTTTGFSTSPGSQIHSHRIDLALSALKRMEEKGILESATPRHVTVLAGHLRLALDSTCLGLQHYFGGRSTSSNFCFQAAGSHLAAVGSARPPGLTAEEREAGKLVCSAVKQLGELLESARTNPPSLGSVRERLELIALEALKSAEKLGIDAQ